MIARVFDGSALAFLAIAAAAAFVAGLVVGAVKGDGAGAAWRGVEAAALALAGGLLARLFVSVLLGLGHDSPGAGLAVGWAFFLWPGAVDTVASLGGARLLTTPEALLWIATGVGAFTGAMDGAWRVHDWKGLGWLSFPLDVTWGLAAVTNAALLHLVNLAWGRHQDEPRRGVHRYASGFRLKSDPPPGFAFTQGSVMSNLPDPPGDPLYAHERTHAWQNRTFGPFFTLSYVGWMAVWFVPGLIAGGSIRAGALQGVEKWCYFNNPWEVWGYAVQHQDRTAFGASPQEKRLIWPLGIVIAWVIPFFALVALGAVLVAARVW